MEDLLTQTGLNELQARTYLYLLKTGEAAPPKVAEDLSITRSNAYKILDKLVEMGLLRRTEVDKKFIYQAEDPIALVSILATERNRLIALEKGVKDAMHELRRTYEQHVVSNDARIYRGNTAVTSLYKAQSELQQPIRFIKSRADIPVMGYETMNKIRSFTAKLGTERYGITQDSPEGVKNPAIDRSTNLTRTWIDANDYTSPVEWSVCGDELLIVSFENEASAVRIKNAVIAKAFRELWQLLDGSIRRDPDYKKLPKHAKRNI